MNYINEIHAKLGSDTAFRSNKTTSNQAQPNDQQQFSDYISNEIGKFRKDVHQFNEEHLKDVSMSEGVVHNGHHHF